MHYSNYPPPAPVRKSNAPLIVLAVVLGVIAMMFVGCVALVASVGSEQPSATSAGIGKGAGGGGAGGIPGKAPSAAKIGDKVKDGKFTFIVTKMSTSSTYGDEIFHEKAKGVFVILTVKVTNHGDESQIFEATSQYMYDAKGRKYDAESGMFTENDVFLQSINPGNSVTGKIAFDVPKGAEIATVELHDSMFSDGVRVGLS